MINREDIKKGLKFRMPNDIIRRKYQVASFRGTTDMCESIQYLTTLKTPHGDKKKLCDTQSAAFRGVRRSETDKLRR